MQKHRSLTLLLLFLIILSSSGLLYLLSTGIVTLHAYDEQKIIKQLTADLENKSLSANSPIYMRIFKESSELEIWIQNAKGTFSLFTTYPICRYSGQLGPKLKEGDGQSPEGFYHVSSAQMNPNSSYHLSFNLGFPNAYDKNHGRTGSYLMVHGNCVSIGCYAMTDKKIEEIYTLASMAHQGGQQAIPVHIFPFHMTDDNINQHRDNPWYDFWLNLKEGYDAFEKTHVPPTISVANKRYLITPLRAE